MSYILDALRKSEQERQRGKVPDLNSYKDEPTVEPTRRNIWPWAALVIVVVNVTIIAIIWAPSREPTTAMTPATAVTPTLGAPRATSVSQPPALEAPVATRPVPPPQPVQAETPVAVQPVSRTVVEDSRPPLQSAPTRVSPQDSASAASPEQPVYMEPEPAPSVAYMPQLEELPASERSGIPDMTFSSHMYSSIPRFRSIIINGKRLKEGEYFNQHLQVREITEKGVIMSNGNVMFTVDVLGRWAQ